MLTLDMMMAETLCGTYVEEDGPTEMALREEEASCLKHNIHSRSS